MADHGTAVCLTAGLGASTHKVRRLLTARRNITARRRDITARRVISRAAE